MTTESFFVTYAPFELAEIAGRGVFLGQAVQGDEHPLVQDHADWGAAGAPPADSGEAYVMASKFELTSDCWAASPDRTWSRIAAQ
jgi:hypothetical protein